MAPNRPFPPLLATTFCLLIPFADDNQWIGGQAPRPAFGRPSPFGWGEGRGEWRLEHPTASLWELV